MPSKRFIRHPAPATAPAIPQSIASIMGATRPEQRLSKSAWNFYRCTTCMSFWVTRDADDGLTPHTIACKDRPAMEGKKPVRIGNCPGAMHSAFYPKMENWPDIVPRACDAEWYRPPRWEQKQIKKKNPRLYRWIEVGGLLQKVPEHEYSFTEEMHVTQAEEGSENAGE
jgi:hypothetical protein